ncbi:MAG: hypothetical protein IJ014_00685 [Rikenellaceae bacterium]|nr:hypothetical protein [Rikenellaceae bacterium]
MKKQNFAKRVFAAIMMVLTAVFMTLSMVGCEKPKEGPQTDDQPFLVVDPLELNFEADPQGPLTVTLSSSSEVVASAGGWCKATIKGDIMEVEVLKNELDESRSCEIRLQNLEGLSEKIAVTQLGIEPEVLVSPDSLTSSAEGEQLVFTVTSNLSWTAKCEADWVTVYPEEDKFIVDVEPNTTVEGRSTIVTVVPVLEEMAEYAKSVKVSQEAMTTALVVSGEALTEENVLQMDAAEGQTTLSLTANTDWSIECYTPWITISPKRGEACQEETITVKVQENTELAPRNGNIEFTCGETKYVISLQQNGGSVYAEIDEAQKQLSFPDIATTQTVTVKTNGYVKASASADWLTAEVNQEGAVVITTTTNEGAERSATITLTVDSDPLEPTADPVTITITVTQSQKREAIDLSAAGTANTYIVDKAATYYKFNGSVRGNGQPVELNWNSNDAKNLSIKWGYDNSYLNITPAKAILVWYNASKQSDVWVKDSPVVVESVNLGVDGYVYFETPETFINGNVMLAVTDASDEILWSWNIWACEGFNPDATAQTVGDVVMMDRNLGAMIGLEAKGETDPVKAAWAVGNYYQWGRKDPLPTASEYGKADNALPGSMKWGLPTYTPIESLKKDQSRYPWGADNVLYAPTASANSIGLKKTLGDNFTIEQAIAQTVKTPYLWASNGTGTSNDSPYMWMVSNPMDDTKQVTWRALWGNMNCIDGVKTVYDPCPAGWMVPDATSISLALSKSTVTDNGYGVYSPEWNVYIPFGGQRASIYSTVCELPLKGSSKTVYLATSTVSTDSNPFRGTRACDKSNVVDLESASGAASITTSNSYVGAAVPVRCVKEQKVAPAVAAEPAGPKAAFLGDSITEVWEARTSNPDFFTANNYIHQGVSGTVTSNFAMRYNWVRLQDPQVTVICGGINDLAENPGYWVPLEDTYNNIRMIARLAELSGSKVVLGSTPPANTIWWNDADWNAAHSDIGERVVQLNARIKALCEERGYTYCDFHSALKDDANGLALEYSWTESDRVHPNGAGYAVMERIVKPIIDRLTGTETPDEGVDVEFGGSTGEVTVLGGTR